MSQVLPSHCRRRPGEERRVERRGEVKLVKDEWIKNDLGSIEKKRRSASRDNRKLKRVKEDGRESGELNQGGES